MDGLLLLAAMTTAMGYEGRGDFLLDADGHIARVPELTSSPLRLSGRADRASAPVRRSRRRAPSPPTSCGTAPSPKAGCYGTRLDGVWIHVGTPEARDEAEAYLARLAPA